MGELTTDPNDPRLGRGIDTKETDQHEAYLVLSAEERLKGFVRPYRDSYKHIGPPGPQHPIRDLTDEEKERYEGQDYIKFESYEGCTEHDHGSVLGRFWTLDRLAAVDRGGCNSITVMGRALSETYARDPNFYGATYCVYCHKHLAVDEFVWTADGQRVGS